MSYKIEVVRGPEGNCLCIGDDRSGHRITGPKPWGGGTTIHSFDLTLRELKELKKEVKIAIKDLKKQDSEAE